MPSKSKNARDNRYKKRHPGEDRPLLNLLQPSRHEAQTDVSRTNHTEEIRRPASSEYSLDLAQIKQPNSGVNALPSSNNPFTSEQVSSYAPSGLQNVSSSTLTPSPGNIQGDSTSSTMFNNKTHHFERQSDRSVICSWCGMDKEIDGPGCQGEKELFSMNPIDCYRQAHIQ